MTRKSFWKIADSERAGRQKMSFNTNIENNIAEALSKTRAYTLENANTLVDIALEVADILESKIEGFDRARFMKNSRLGWLEE